MIDYSPFDISCIRDAKGCEAGGEQVLLDRTPGCLGSRLRRAGALVLGPANPVKQV